MRSMDWSSDVLSSDLRPCPHGPGAGPASCTNESLRKNGNGLRKSSDRTDLLLTRAKAEGRNAPTGPAGQLWNHRQPARPGVSGDRAGSRAREGHAHGRDPADRPSTPAVSVTRGAAYQRDAARLLVLPARPADQHTT